MEETVQVILEDESRNTNPNALVEAMECLSRLRKLGNHCIVFETEDSYIRIEVCTEKKQAFWKRLFTRK